MLERSVLNDLTDLWPTTQDRQSAMIDRKQNKMFGWMISAKAGESKQGAVLLGFRFRRCRFIFCNRWSY